MYTYLLPHKVSMLNCCYISGARLLTSTFVIPFISHSNHILSCQMPYIDPVTDCKYKAHNVRTSVNSIIFDEFENIFLLETYLECLQESQKAVEKLIETLKAK